MSLASTTTINYAIHTYVHVHTLDMDTHARVKCVASTYGTYAHSYYECHIITTYTYMLEGEISHSLRSLMLGVSLVKFPYTRLQYWLRGVGTATTGTAMAVALFCMTMMSSFHRRMVHAPNIVEACRACVGRAQRKSTVDELCTAHSARRRKKKRGSYKPRRTYDNNI